MNVIGNAQITSPSEKEETCILFIIDDTTVPFALNNVTEKEENYVFSFWAKTDTSASLKICEEEIAISTEWKRYKVNFTAIEENIKIFFNNPQIYYLYRAQLEKGNVLTDWKPSPGDINASLELKADKEKLISEINASADVIRLKSNRLVVESDNLQILEDGTLKTKRGKIADFDINEDGLTYGDEESRVYTKISGTGIRWISGIEEYNYNEVADRIEAYYENRAFQFYRALKEEENDSYDLTPIGGIDANGMYKGESYADWVNTPADYIVNWDGRAKFTDLSVCGRQYGVNKVLWSGAWYMNASQTATLSEAISSQPNGIVLVFSPYTSSTSRNYGWTMFFIPKYMVATYGSANNGFDFHMFRGASFQKAGGKYIFISDTTITGYDNNVNTGTGDTGIVYTNDYWVLRYVIGV